VIFSLVFLFFFSYNMTQHIKTHFKARGINSLANNPANLVQYLNGAGREGMPSMTSPNGAPMNPPNAAEPGSYLPMNGTDIDPEDRDTNQYEDEELNLSKAEDQEHIDPCA
jgi:hypothetical protein